MTLTLLVGRESLADEYALALEVLTLVPELFTRGFAANEVVLNCKKATPINNSRR